MSDSKDFTSNLEGQPVPGQTSRLPRYTKVFWRVAFAAAMIMAALWPVLVNWYGTWNEKDGYYSHGFLVPPIAAFMLWTIRGRLTKAEIRPSWLGLALLIAFLPVYVVGLMMGLRAIYGLTFFLCVFGVMLMLFGKQITRIAAVPILFLVTMMPLASSVLDTLTFRGQLISTTVATKFLQLIFSGSDVAQQGNQIVSPGIPGGVLVIATPCSGLRLLISLITFTWFFVYVIKAAPWKKAALVLTSFPLAVFINSLRITMIGCVGFWTESSEAMHRFHDYSGYIGLVVCFVILFGIAKLIKASEFYSEPPVEATEAICKRWSTPVGTGATGVAVAAMLAVGIVASLTAKPLYDLPTGKIGKDTIARSFGSWVGRDIPIDEGSKKILSKGDLLSRVYADVGNTGREVQVFVDAGLDITAFHDPHLCLPGGGLPIAKDQFITLSLKEPKPMTVKATLLQASSDYGSSLFIYFYMLGDESFPRTDDVFARNRSNKQHDLLRLLTSPWSTDEMRRDILSRQFTWYRFSTDIVDDKTDRQFLTKFIQDFVAHTKGFGSKTSR